ncbi:MAG: epoxyqueuosine reductase QueH [Candidatus Riflebacteria bacterium]|nr:epoxyqueuosine reductase QueH [Candidatus Riflebacteria bacterium]
MILTHACCGPCLGGAYETLAGVGHGLVAFWENPNIHPYLEYKSRLEAFQKLVKALHIPVVYGEVSYTPERFFAALNNMPSSTIKSEEQAPADEFGPGRCLVCFRLRLDATARRARSMGCEAFTTTLQISPYQNRELLLQAANEVSSVYSVPFHAIDLRPVFSKTHEVIRAHELYKQKYCGCIFSERDRYANDRRFSLPTCLNELHELVTDK